MNYTHGDSKIRFYHIWESMKTRSTNPNNKYYKKGIRICNEWLVYETFKKDMYDSYLKHAQLHGEENTTIDRINTNGNYELSNCRWATYQEQAKNRNSNIWISYKNEVKCLNDWAKELDIPRLTLLKRLESGWDITKAFETPVKRGQRTKQQTITYNNETKTIKEWSDITGLLPCTIRIRLKRGWTIQKALNK